MVQGYSPAGFASLPLPNPISFEDDPGFGLELGPRPCTSLEPGDCCAAGMYILHVLYGTLLVILSFTNAQILLKLNSCNCCLVSVAWVAEEAPCEIC